MTTPTIILCLLLVPLLAARVIGGVGKTRLGGTLGIALAFAFFGVGQFVMTDAMARMLPPFVPLAIPLVYATGLLEFGVAAGLLHPASRKIAGQVALVVLVTFFPANVYAAVNEIGTAATLRSRPTC